MTPVPRHDSPLLQFGRAAAAATLRWHLAFALWLPSLLVAALATLPLAGTAERLAGMGGLAEQAGSGGYVEVALELALALGADESVASGEDARGLLISAGIGALLAVAAVPVNGLIYSFVAGGVLERLVGRGGSFWTACRSWFWPMLRFGLLAMVVFGIVAATGLGGVLLVPGGNAFNDGLRVLLFGGWMALANGLLATARADMVVRSDRRALAAIGRSLALLRRPGALMLWLGVGVLGAIHASLVGGVLFGVSALVVVPAALTFQAAALVGAWLKLLQLAVGVEVAQAVLLQRGTRLAEGEHMTRGLAAGGL